MNDIPFVDRLGDALERAITPEPPPRRNWGPIAAAAGFAVVLGAGAVWWVVGAGSQEPRPDPVATTGATTSPPPPATTPPTTQPEPLALPAEWARVPGLEAISGEEFVTLNTLESGPAGFVAAGTASDGNELGGAVILRSTDGVAWEALPVSGLDGAYVNDVAVSAAGSIVGVGGEVTDVPQPRFWIFDGAGWAAAAAPSDLPAAQANVALALPDGFVAGGTAYVDAPRFDRQVGVVWVSLDGTAWQEVAHPSFDAPATADVMSLAARDGRVVAGGLWSDRELGSQPVVWISDDRAEWERIELPNEADGFAGVNGLAVGGPGFVAVGWVDEAGTVGAIWTSPDGEGWERVPHDEGLFGAGGTSSTRIQDVAAVPGGLVAVGFESLGPRSRQVFWTSPDGREWRRADVEAPDGADGATTATDVAAYGEVVLAVGAQFALGRNEAIAAAWVSPVPEGLAAVPPVVAAPPPPARDDPGVSVVMEPPRATPSTSVLAVVDGPPGEDNVVWLLPPGGDPVEACTAAARGGRQRWCRFQPADLGLAEPGVYGVALDEPAAPLAESSLEVVAPGTVLVGIDAVHTPFIHPLVQQVSVRNHGDEPLDLEGWSLQSRSGGERFAFPAFELPPATTLIVFQGDISGSRCQPDGPLLLRTCNHFEGGTGATAYWAGGVVLVDPAGDVRAEWAPAR